jgi:hypothetical protein
MISLKDLEGSLGGTFLDLQGTMWRTICLFWRAKVLIDYNRYGDGYLILEVLMESGGVGLLMGCGKEEGLGMLGDINTFCKFATACEGE